MSKKSLVGDFRKRTLSDATQPDKLLQQFKESYGKQILLAACYYLKNLYQDVSSAREGSQVSGSRRSHCRDGLMAAA